ncbi:hypothetical protein THIOSC13_1330001 [uncultured Thiomicrorhabdus sp.]
MSQIIRILKHNSVQKIGAMSNHNDRKSGCENYFKNANPEKLSDNYYLKGSDASADARSRLSEIRPKRKNAVLAVEFVITASPEEKVFKTEESERAYFEKSVQWLRDRYGSENVVNAVVHKDEKTPHMHVVVIPEHEGRLSATHYFGNKQKMEGLWTDFNSDVASKFGLTRNTVELDQKKAEASAVGFEHKQSHKSLREFYSELPEQIQGLKKDVRVEESKLSELESEIEQKTAYIQKQTDQIEKNREKLTRMNESGKAKIGAIAKLEKRIGTYESRKETAEKELGEIRATYERWVESERERQKISNQASSLNDLEQFETVTEHNLFSKNKVETTIRLEDAKAFMHKRLNAIEDEVRRELRGQIERDVKRDFEDEANRLDESWDNLERSKEVFQSRRNALEERIEVYESVMTTEQKNRSESILESRLNRNNSNSLSMRM